MKNRTWKLFGILKALYEYQQCLWLKSILVRKSQYFSPSPTKYHYVVYVDMLLSSIIWAPVSLCPSLLDEFKSFLKRLPATHFLPVSSVHLLWGSDWDLQNRYRLLQSSLEAQRVKIQRTARKLFGLSIRCHHNPNHQMPRERWETWCSLTEEYNRKTAS